MRRLFLLLLVPALALAGCGNKDDAGQGLSLVDKVTREVREEMASENLDLGRVSGLPRAALTPEGELLVDGKAVGLDASQRALAMDYRAQVAGIAEAGAALGIESAYLAKESLGIALGGLLSGEGTEAVERKTKEKAREIEKSALVLCERLPALLAAEQALSAAVPEFAPYAGMDESDIEDCRVNIN